MKPGKCPGCCKSEFVADLTDVRQVPSNRPVRELSISNVGRCFLWATFVVLILGAVIAALYAGSFRPPGPVVWDGRFGDYEVRIYRKQKESLVYRISEHLPRPFARLGFRLAGDSPNAAFEIRKNGRRIHHQFGFAFEISEISTGAVSERKVEIMGRDITGDGSPEIAITEWVTRWASVLHVFECGESFRAIATVESLGLRPELIDLDGDEMPEVITADNAFYHWPSGIDGEPMPKVILQWRDGGYHVAKKLMARPAPSTEELETKARIIRSSPEWEGSLSWTSIPVELFPTALDLMYSGHEELGWKLIQSAWNDKNPDKELVLEKLRDRLGESSYWQELQSPRQTKAFNKASLVPAR